MSYVSIEEKRKRIKQNLLWGACVLLLVVVIALAFKIIVDKGIFSSGGKGDNGGNPSSSSTEKPTEPPTPSPTPYDYINEEGTDIAERFNAPEGYEKVESEKGSFGEYLKNYPLKGYGEQAYLYDDKAFPGEELVYSEETSTVGVFKQQDTLTRWQQCADTAIMLYAEYLWDQQRYDEIIFNFASGFECAYSKWAEGYRVDLSGKGAWVNKAGKNGVIAGDYTYQTFLKYLDLIYQYANTDSLATQFNSVSFADLMPGDIVVATRIQLREAAKEIDADMAASIDYGHAMIVVDVAVNAQGEKVFMLAEGNTPATEAAVLENPDASMGVWFKLDSDGRFVKSSSGIRWKSSWFYTFNEPKE